MKRFLSFLAFALLGPLWRMPAWAQLTTLGVGGIAAVVVGTLMTPAIVPQPSSYFNINSPSGSANNALKPNGGTAGAEFLPTTVVNSHVIYVEGITPTAITNNEYALGRGGASQGLELGEAGPGGQPSFYFQSSIAGSGFWWTAINGVNTLSGGMSASAGTGYNTGGYFPFTASGGGCARPPSGIWTGTAGTIPATDPGFLCSGTVAPTATVLSVPGTGAQQATGAGSIATTCTPNSPVSGQVTITAHVAVAHGYTPGQTYAMGNFPSPFSTTYTALPGTSGTTIVGTAAINSGACTGFTGEGTAFSGTGSVISLPASAAVNNPFVLGGTAITVKTAQHFCEIIGEYGANSPFPGAQFASFVDDKGNALPGAPALVPWLNQGTANATGFIAAGAQPALTVTAMTPYRVTAASFNATTGYVTFTVSTNPVFVPGSEFTVTGASPSGYNQTYVAVAGTSGTTLVGNALSGQLGTMQAISNPGAYSSGGTAVSVIMPQMAAVGLATQAFIAPFGTSGGTGTGGVGTYALTSNQGNTSNVTVTAVTAPSGGTSTMTISGTIDTMVAGQTLTNAGYTTTGPLVIINQLTGTPGAAGTYNVSNPNTGTISATTTFTNQGIIGSVGTPVNLFFAPLFYQTVGASLTAPGAVTPRTQAALGDFITLIGSETTALSNLKGGWGGSLANVAMLYGAFPQAAGGAPDTTKLASLCKKTSDIQTFATSNGLTVHSLYRLNDLGIWADSSAAQFTGTITGASGSTATLNVAATQTGAIPTQPSTPATIIAGVGVAGCPQACPTITGGSGGTYTLSFGSGTAANLSSTPMTAGAFQPAAPLVNNSVNGFISGNTLTVTSVQASATSTFTGQLNTQFTAKIDNGSGAAGNILTVTAPTNFAATGGGAVLGPGMTISDIAGVVAPGTTLQAQTSTTGAVGGTFGMAGTYTLSGSAQLVASKIMQASGPLPSFATQLNFSGATGPTPVGGMIVTDGGVHINGASPLLLTSVTGTTGLINPNYYPTIAPETMYGTLTSVVPGQYVVGPGITTPVSITGIQSLTPCAAADGNPATGFPACGVYTLSSSANSVGSSGSHVAFTLTGIGDGGALAPGPALTIKDQGAGVTFPATNISCTGFGACTGTGSVPVSGTFDTSVLGGMPSSIQAQISTTAGGPAVPGCSACAWANLAGYSATLSSGTVFNWSGHAVNIPATQGPLFVSVRAANGTAYATMPNLIKMGLAFDVNGEGQVGPFFSTQGGLAINYFQGLNGYSYWQGMAGGNSFLDQGPAVSGTSWSPGIPDMYPGDRFSLTGNPPPTEGVGFLQQTLTNAFGGWPVTVVERERDGIGTSIEALGNQVQTQSVAIGDGSSTTFCSAAKFCSNASASGPLFYNAAAFTGATLAGASISGTTLTVPATTGLPRGALEPGLVLTDTTGHITGSPTLVNCLTGCTFAAFNSDLQQTWTISVSQTVAAEAMRADPVGGAPAPLEFLQINGLPLIGNGSFGQQLMQAGTFKITVNGTVVCQDTTVFAYNNLGGNCTGAGITSSFVNYNSGDYEVVFNSPPANSAVIVASWTNIVTPDVGNTATERPQGLDFFGDGKFGAMSSLFTKVPGGVNGHIFGDGIGDAGLITLPGYAIGGPGYTQQTSWIYNSKMPSIIPGETANTPFILGNYWRGEGVEGFLLSAGAGNSANGALFEQWVSDVTAPSTFPGTISGSTLTLTSAATGSMWEGEVLGCNPFSLGCQVAPGTYITALATGVWGASGSTYSLNQSGCLTTCTGIALANALQYPGPGPSIFAGPLNDIAVQGNPGVAAAGQSFHGTNGFAGAGGRVGRRWAAAVWGGLTNPNPALPAPNASNPTLDRVKADALGCDTNALAAPCLDDGTKGAGHAFPATATATWTGSVATVTGGLAANARPFVVGQALSCSGCNTGLVIVAVSMPPTQDVTRPNAGQVGNTFTVTANAAIGGSGSGTITGGCKSSGAGQSNCIAIAFSINTTNGTYGTAASLATCGENNLNGNAPLDDTPNGVCQDNGLGELVRGFRIGTQQATNRLVVGTPYDDGADPAGGGFAQNLAFTCNLVAAKLVECVKGPTWTAGIPALGQWTAGSTFIGYGDSLIATSRVTGMMGYPGGQSLTTMPSGVGSFNGGSGYAPGLYTVRSATQPIASASYVSSTGILTMNFATAPFGAAVGTQANGSSVTVAGLTGTGVAALNGPWPITGTAVSGTQVTVQAPTGLGTLTIGVTAAGSILSSCGTLGPLGGGTIAVAPALDLTVGSGGSIIDAYPSTINAAQNNAIGNGNMGVNGVCQFFLTAGGGTGGSITLNVGSTEGLPGIGTYNTDSNLMGIFLYDNSGFRGNPLNPFFTNSTGGYFEPGLPVKPFGEFLGVGVSG